MNCMYRIYISRHFNLVMWGRKIWWPAAGDYCLAWPRKARREPGKMKSNKAESELSFCVFIVQFSRGGLVDSQSFKVNEARSRHTCGCEQFKKAIKLLARKLIKPAQINSSGCNRRPFFHPKASISYTLREPIPTYNLKKGKQTSETSKQSRRANNLSISFRREENISGCWKNGKLSYLSALGIKPHRRERQIDWITTARSKEETASCCFAWWRCSVNGERKKKVRPRLFGLLHHPPSLELIKFICDFFSHPLKLVFSSSSPSSLISNQIGTAERATPD